MLEDLTHALEALFTDLRASLAAAGKTFDAGVLGQRMAGIQRSLAVSVAELDDKNHTLQDLNRRLLQAYEIIENTNIVLMEWTLVQDIPTKFVTENIRQYGFEPQDFYTGFLKDYWDFIHPDDRNAARTLVHQMRARHVADYKHRYRVVCRDGAVRWVEENTLLDFDETGIPIRERGILYDITNIMEIDDRCFGRAVQPGLVRRENRRAGTGAAFPLRGGHRRHEWPQGDQRSVRAQGWR